MRRAGCDPAPLDPRSAQDRLTLTSYVWGDQLHRFERLRGALAVAAAAPLTVEPLGAAEFLSRELAEPCPGVLTVVWQSVVRQYLTRDERVRIEAVLADAGTRATAHAPLAHLSMEGERTGERNPFVLTLTSWPGEGLRVVADCEGHGPPVRWRAG